MPGAFRLQVDDAGNRWTVTFPDPYVVAPGVSGDTIVVTFGAVVNDVAGNTRNTQTRNAVDFAFTNAVGPQTESAAVNTRIVEPNIEVDKRNDDADGTVGAGQTLTYTVDALNRNTVASVSTANDTVVVDSVPDELIVLEALVAPSCRGRRHDRPRRRHLERERADYHLDDPDDRSREQPPPAPIRSPPPIRGWLPARSSTTSRLDHAPPDADDASRRTGTDGTEQLDVADGGPGSGYQDGDDSQVVAPSSPLRPRPATPARPRWARRSSTPSRPPSPPASSPPTSP